MTTCTCRTCNCSEEEIAEYRKARELHCDPVENPSEKIRAAFAPKEDGLAQSVAGALRDHETQGEYDLTGLKGRRFYHEVCDVVPLLGRALDWIEARPHLTVLDIRYDNSSFEGYSESITVIAEEG